MNHEVDRARYNARIRMANLLADASTLIGEKDETYGIEHWRQIWEEMMRKSVVGRKDDILSGKLDHFPDAKEDLRKAMDGSIGINPIARKKINNYLARNTDKVVAVKRVEKANRRKNFCYENADKEFKETGNPMVYGLTAGGSMATDNCFFLVPHCFNYNPKTNIYYDTTPSHEYQMGVPFFTALIINTRMPSCSSFVCVQTADTIVGGYIFITKGDDTHILVGKRHTDTHLYKDLAYIGKA